MLYLFVLILQQQHRHAGRNLQRNPQQQLHLIHHDGIVSIDNHKYRETTTNKPSYFPILLENTVTSKKINTTNILDIEKIIAYQHFYFESGLRNIVISGNNINKKSATTNTHKINDPSLDFVIDHPNTQAHIITKFSAIPLTNGSNLDITLLLNNAELSKSTFVNTYPSRHPQLFITNKKLTLNRGYYRLYFSALSQTSQWCSCPEIENGYQMSRFISLWDFHIKKNNSAKGIISTSISIANSLYQKDKNTRNYISYLLSPSQL